MRLKLLVGGVIVLALALVIAACGGGGSSSSSSANAGEGPPSVELECVEEPCGSNPEKDKSHGYYRVHTNNFPPDAVVLISVIRPNGEPYPYNQYTPPGKAFGVEGNKQSTNEEGQLTEFKWAAHNEGGPPDEPGTYELTFHFEVGGEIMEISKEIEMVSLP